MNCVQFRHLLDRYLDGDLNGSFKLEFEAHMVECESCGHEFATTRAVGQILSMPAPDEPELGDAFTKNVLSGFDDMHRHRQRWYHILSTSAAAAAIVLLVSSLLIIAGPQGTSTVASADDTATLDLAPVGKDAASLDTQDQHQIDIELRDWLASTFQEADAAISQIREIPGFYMGHMLGIGVPDVTPADFTEEPFPIDEAAADPNYELI